MKFFRFVDFVVYSSRERVRSVKDSFKCDVLSGWFLDGGVEIYHLGEIPIPTKKALIV